MPTLTRRRLLASTGAGVTGLLAGCTGGRSSGDRLTVETLAVAGFPAETVPVKPTGKAVLLDFFATWCTPCKPQMAGLRRVRDRFDRETLHMLSITNEENERAVRSFWREYDGTWPVALDPSLKTNDRFGATRIPTLIVFSPDGTETWRHVGLAAAETMIRQIESAQA